MQKRRIVLILILPLLLWRCAPTPLQSEIRDVPAPGWQLDSTIRFTMEATPSADPIDIYFYLRHDHNYPNANLYLLVEVVSPNGSVQHDTLNFPLASPRGEWFGKGFGELRELLLPYRTGTRFAQPGLYQFSLRHGMRYDTLLGVREVGIFVYPHSESERSEQDE